MSLARILGRSVRLSGAAALAVLLVVGVSGCQVGTPQTGLKPLTWEHATRGGLNVAGSYASGLEWAPDGGGYFQRRGRELKRVAAETGKVQSADDVDAFRDALAALDDFDDEEAERCARRPMAWNDARATALVEHKQRLYLYHVGESPAKRLTDEDAERRVVTLSPDGRRVSFVQDDDLFVIDAETGKQRQLTKDGSETLLNGVLDWVYQEEIYGRGDWRAQWWRGDGGYLAFLRLDEEKVPVYSVVDYIPHMSKVERTPYPKPGDPLPKVRLGVANAASGKTVWADLAKYEEHDPLITAVSWTPDGQVLFSVQDREQRWLDLNEMNPATGKVTNILRETSPAWTENLPHPHWLKDGTFLWVSDRTGYRHIYHYSRHGTLIRAITAGAWPVRELAGADAENEWVYFTGSRDTTVETQAYRVKLAGSAIEQLTESGYHHAASFDPKFHYFIDTFSNVETPTQVHLRRADGSQVRAISENHVDVVDEYVWSKPQILQVPNRDGNMLNAALILPPDYDPHKRYPVFCPVYGGPDAPTVRNEWRGHGVLMEQYLAQQGYIIWHCDPYHATGGVAKAAWSCYKHLGPTELADIEDSLHWLIDQGYADPQRIGIMGYSYGGYFAAYALTHSDMFKMGIAGSLVSDWHLYDAVYTERFMQTPEHNPDGYEAGRVDNAAERLHGRLLIVHGLMDDNVHFQNTARLIDALQQADEDFDLMVYPRDRHGIGRGRIHHADMRLHYILDKL